MTHTDLRLKKSLGQHFLHNEAVCQRIVQLISREPGLQIVEIGPGAGALTKYLLEWPDIHYKGIEIDTEKVAYLLRKYPVLSDKVLAIDFLKTTIPFKGNLTLIGNFPYNISSSILFRVLEWEAQVQEIVGMFQREVALRIASSEGSKAYGILSVLMQTFYEITYAFDVPPEDFTPPPKVNSGVLHFRNTGNPYQISDKAAFIRFVKQAFGKRRKTLKNNLKGFLPTDRIDSFLLSQRAEQLSVPTFVELFKKLMLNK